MFATYCTPGGATTTEIPTASLNGQQSRINELNGIGIGGAYGVANTGIPTPYGVAPLGLVGATVHGTGSWAAQPFGTINPLGLGAAYGQFSAYPQSAVHGQIPTSVWQNTVAPQIAPAWLATGYPTGQQYNTTIPYGLNLPGVPTVNPFINPFVNTVPTVNPFINPFVNTIPTVNPFINPFVNTIPTVNPFINPFVNTIPTVNPFVNPFINGLQNLNPLMNPLVNTIPAVNPFVSTPVNPFVNAVPTVNPFVNPLTLSNPLTTVNPFVNVGGLVNPLANINACVNGIAPVNPLVGTVPTINPIVSAATTVNPLTGIPSLGNVCGTQTPYGIPSNGFFGGLNGTMPFINTIGNLFGATTPWNTVAATQFPALTGWMNPYTCGTTNPYTTAIQGACYTGQINPQIVNALRMSGMTTWPLNTLTAGQIFNGTTGWQNFASTPFFGGNYGWNAAANLVNPWCGAGFCC